MTVPSVGETIHVMLAKLANGAPRCFKLDHDAPSPKRRKGPEHEKAGKGKRLKLGGSNDMATFALSPEGTVLNGANGALLPEHAGLAGVWCSRTCLACTDALLRFGSQNVSSVPPSRRPRRKSHFVRSLWR